MRVWVTDFGPYPHTRPATRPPRTRTRTPLGYGSGTSTSTKVSVIIWKSVVRSILEYGCEVWGEGIFPEFEKLQIEMGRRILRCGPRMSNVVVRGELGWWTLRARRDELRLRFWRTLTEMKEQRIPRIVYEESRHRLHCEEEAGMFEPKRGVVTRNNF